MDHVFIYNKKTKQYETIDRYSIGHAFGLEFDFQPEDATQKWVFNNEEVRVLISDGTIDQEKYVLQELGV